MSVVSMGELLIDFVALESGVTVGDASGFQKAPGGAPANLAVAVARLGMASAFIGQVGDDPFGHFLADVMSAEDVNVDGLRFTDEARTMLAFVSLAEGGERSFNFYRHPSADMLMTAADVAEDVIKTHDVFHFGSITLISEPARSATLHAASVARDAGKLISYDPNLRRALWASDDEARAGMLLGFEYANIVKISEEEVLFLTGNTDVSALMRPHTQVICVTRGEHGSSLHLPDGTTVSHKGFVVKSVDTTGAGDSFGAGFLVAYQEALAQGRPDDDALTQMIRFANAVGAITTTTRGAIPALPNRAQVEAFLKKHRG
jgi:fructokinase